MILVIGLGNPGKKYIKTRHNLGFRIVNQFAKESRFSNFKIVKKYNSLISKSKLNNEKIILAKPQAFMNNSGKAVKKISKNLKSKFGSLIVIHDDLDLPLGKIRIIENRGAAGHKGVQSIIDELDTKNFTRFRIGIMNYELRIKNTEEFVLEKFKKEEEGILKEVIKKSCLALKTAIIEGIDKAMNEFNK
jgi:PTH1 family peptidyl-tRNA hydrolase